MSRKEGKREKKAKEKRRQKRKEGKREKKRSTSNHKNSYLSGNKSARGKRERENVTFDIRRLIIMLLLNSQIHTK